MDYQTLFELGELTPRQLRAWMDVDPTNAARALRQRPELMEGLRNILSEESTSPEVNRPQSAYDQIGDMREDVFGIDSDDGLLTRAAKGLGNAVVSPLALGAAGGDYLKAGFNELTGNEEGLQFEDTPGASDIIGDGINTALAAATGGTGNIIKAGVGNLVKNGVKNTLGKAKGKVLGSATGKALLGGPKRRLATGIGAASLLGAHEESSDEGVTDDIIDTAPKPPKESLSSADLDAPITNPVTGRQSPISLDSPSANARAAAPMQQAPDLSNPAGLVAMANNLGRSSNSLLGRSMQGDLTAQASRQIRRDIANQKGEDKIKDVFNSRDRALRMAWLNSPTNKAGIPFEQLSPAEQMKMRENYFASRRAGSYNSRDERKKELAAKFKATGSYGVGELDDMTEEEFMKKSGMQNPGTMLVSNPDGTFTTNETKQAFDRAGGRDSAQNVFDDLGDNGAMGANLDHQLNGDRTVIGKDGQRLEDLTPGSVRMSSNDSDYDDARFNSREDALKYLNRKPVSEPPAPTPAPEISQASNDAESYMDNTSSVESSSPAPTSGFKPYYPTLDVPAPGKSSVSAKAPESAVQPETQASSDSDSFMDWENLLYLAPFALSRGKIKPKNLRLPNFTKIKKPQGIPLRQKRLGNKGQLENNRPYQLENKPLRLENNRPYQLDNRVATPEQVRKMQTGMGSSERAADKYARLRESMAERGFITDGLF